MCEQGSLSVAIGGSNLLTSFNVIVIVLGVASAVLALVVVYCCWRHYQNRRRAPNSSSDVSRLHKPKKAKWPDARSLEEPLDPNGLADEESEG
jgi:hypothetical protein